MNLLSIHHTFHLFIIPAVGNLVVCRVYAECGIMHTQYQVKLYARCRQSVCKVHTERIKYG